MSESQFEEQANITVTVGGTNVYDGWRDKRVLFPNKT
jgi:hypothetical protein